MQSAFQQRTPSEIPRRAAPTRVRTPFRVVWYLLNFSPQQSRRDDEGPGEHRLQDVTTELIGQFRDGEEGTQHGGLSQPRPSSVQQNRWGHYRMIRTPPVPDESSKLCRPLGRTSFFMSHQLVEALLGLPGPAAHPMLWEPPRMDHKGNEKHGS